MSRIKSMLLTGVPASGALGGGASFLPFTDSFDTDGAMASPWLNTGWAVSGGAAVAAVTLGAELLTNGDFSAWTADNPDGWIVNGESGSDPEVSEVGSGEGHGGTGTGSANIYTTGALVFIGQLNILNSGYFSTVAMTISTVTAGGVKPSLGLSQITSYTTSGTKIFTYKPATTDSLSLVRLLSGSPNDVTIDNVSVKRNSLSSMLQLVDASAPNVTATVKATVTTNTQTGIALCWNSDTDPANGVIGFYDRIDSHAKLLKLVSGTWTTVIDAAATYSAGAVVKVVQTGDTTFQLWYNGVQIGTDVTISDAGIIGNTLHGIFSTYSGNSFDDFTLEAS